MFDLDTVVIECNTSPSLLYSFDELNAEAHSTLSNPPGLQAEESKWPGGQLYVAPQKEGTAQFGPVWSVSSYSQSNLSNMLLYTGKRLV